MLEELEQREGKRVSGKEGGDVIRLLQAGTEGGWGEREGEGERGRVGREGGWGEREGVGRDVGEVR